MQIAYIISSHRRPDLLFRLVDALAGAPIAIHVDRKSSIGPEVDARAKAYRNVTILPSYVCHWGLFGHVEASLEGLNWFAGTQAEHAVLLTGQCYPIKPLPVIEAAISGLGGNSVIEIAAFPKAEWLAGDDGGYKRIDRFWIKWPRQVRPEPFKLWRRQLPYGLHPYGGGSYWCLSRQAVEYVVQFIAGHPRFVDYCRTVFVPDEMFFQTILGNSPLRDRLVNSLIHYTDWSKGGASPAVLGAAELPAVLASDYWFARKFDDTAVLDAIDTALADR